MRHTFPLLAKILVISALASYWGLRAVGQETHAQPDDTLALGFENPPNSAAPRVWWHWMNGNVTQQGITADLEWMKSVHIGGMTMFDGDVGTHVVVDKPLIWRSYKLQKVSNGAYRVGFERSASL